MKSIVMFLLLASTCFAGEINYCDVHGKCQKIIYNDKYSNKDFTGRNLLDAKDLEGAVMFGSCFSQENPNTKVIPENIKNITFVNCNLDNVSINPKWATIGCSERKFKVQNDRQDWLLDNNDNPKEPINKEEYQKLRLSINPQDLPTVMIEKDIIKEKQKELSQ